MGTYHRVGGRSGHQAPSSDVKELLCVFCVLLRLLRLHFHAESDSITKCPRCYQCRISRANSACVSGTLPSRPTWQAAATEPR